MYEKMIQIDPNAPTEEEHLAKGVTKPRYMVSVVESVEVDQKNKFIFFVQVWRETISSTESLGFRIEGIKKDDLKSKDFKTIKAKEEIKEMFKEFCAGYPHALVSFD